MKYNRVSSAHSDSVKPIIQEVLTLFTSIDKPMIRQVAMICYFLQFQNTEPGQM